MVFNLINLSIVVIHDSHGDRHQEAGHERKAVDTADQGSMKGNVPKILLKLFFKTQQYHSILFYVLQLYWVFLDKSTEHHQ